MVHNSERVFDAMGLVVNLSDALQECDQLSAEEKHLLKEVPSMLVQYISVSADNNALRSKRKQIGKDLSEFVDTLHRLFSAVVDDCEGRVHENLIVPLRLSARLLNRIAGREETALVPHYKHNKGR